MSKLIMGCGYVGRRVAGAWVKAGQRVYATTRGQEETLQQLGCRPVRCDVLSPHELNTLPAMETVLYAVGYDRRSPASMREVYVEGLKRVLEVLPPCQKFIYLSSTSVYGQNDGQWVTEESPTEPEETSGQIVLEAEQILRGKIPSAVILRLAGIYGPGRWLRAQAIQEGKPIVGRPDRWLNLIHVDDVVSAIQAAESLAPPGCVLNLADNEPVLRKDFFAYLAQCLKAPPPRFEIPPADQPLPPHERSHRRIANRKMYEVLQIPLKFPTYRQGLGNHFALS